MRVAAIRGAYSYRISLNSRPNLLRGVLTKTHFKTVHICILHFDHSQNVLHFKLVITTLVSRFKHRIHPTKLFIYLGA